MILAADIGNTVTTLGVVSGERVIRTFRLTSGEKKTSDEWGIQIAELLKLSDLRADDIEGVVISSVVPEIMHSFTAMVRKYLDKEPLIVGPGIKTGIHIHFDNPKEVGADRIVDAAGAHFYYGGDCLVIDFGTATTFEYIDAAGTYHGGCMVPGLEISSRALSSKASKLPEIEIMPMKKVIASDTVAAMQSGLFYGYVGQVEYLITKIKKETGKDLRVIATGGIGSSICQYTKLIDVYDPDLAFKGLKYIYDRNV